MQISKRSLLYRIAYWWPKKESEKPDRVSICRLFWRFVLVLPVSYFVALICLIIMAGVFLISFMFGYRPTVCEGDDENETWAKIAPNKWPKIKGHRVWPVNILLLGLLIYCIPLEIFLAANWISQMVNWIGGNLGTASIVFTVFLALALVILFFSSGFFRSIVWPSLKAKIEKVCPCIEFVD